MPTTSSAPGPWRDAHRPDLVIRFGATPTSKPLLTCSATAAPTQIVVDGDRGWSEPALIPTTFVQADATATALRARRRARRGGSARRRRPTARGPAPGATPTGPPTRRSATGWRGVEARGEAFEGLPFAVLGDVLPDGALLWAGNSMPVRDLDDWLPGSERAIRPLSNRGANGIDGVVSTALGAAAAGGRAGRRWSSATCRSCTT